MAVAEAVRQPRCSVRISFCKQSCFYHPPPNTPYPALLPFHRAACRLEEEGREDKMAWEGLSPNCSICFLFWLTAGLCPALKQAPAWCNTLENIPTTGLTAHKKITMPITMKMWNAFEKDNFANNYFWLWQLILDSLHTFLSPTLPKHGWIFSSLKKKVIFHAVFAFFLHKALTSKLVIKDFNLCLVR